VDGPAPPEHDERQPHSGEGAILVTPEQFGPYRLEELIGRGGMGEVFRAFDTVRKRTVAVKRLPGHLAADASFAARFRRESELAARLSEPHIIPIHDYGEIDGQLYLDMPLVSGVDLATLLEEGGPLPPARAVDVVAQVASALDAAHARGLVHRDVKPSNILIARGARGDSDFVYLVDFGVARAIGMSETALTGTGMTVGTFDYMAPERFTGRADDLRVDVYALACVLYEALTGRKPFTGDGLPALLHAHLSLDPPAPSTLRAEIPVALDDVVARGLAKDPDDRYPSAARLAAGARAALSSPPGGGSAPPTVVGVATVAPPAPEPAFFADRPVEPLGGPAESARVSRLLAVVSIAGGPVLLTAGALLLIGVPDPDRDVDAFLDHLAVHSTRYLTAALVTMFGLLLLVVGLVGVVHLLRSRRVNLGQAGAALLLVSAFLGNSYAFEVVVAAAGRADARDAAVTLLDTAGSSPWLEVVRVALLGSVLGLVLLAVGLIQRRVTAMWIPVLLVLGAVVRTVIGQIGLDLDPRTLGVLDMALFAIPAVGIGMRILRLTDAEWSRWIPLEDVEPRREAVTSPETATTGRSEVGRTTT
jgi:hypothetical protein